MSTPSIRTDKSQRNLTLYKERKNGASFRELGIKYGISAARCRDIVQGLAHEEKWNGPLEEMENRFTLRQVADMLDLSYVATRNLEDQGLKMERIGYGGQTWIRRSALKHYLLEQAGRLQAKSTWYQELADQL